MVWCLVMHGDNFTFTFFRSVSLHICQVKVKSLAKLSTTP